MLERRTSHRAQRRPQRALLEDAQNMKFADDSFDIVYAPYVIQRRARPVAMTRECTASAARRKNHHPQHFRSKSRLGFVARKDHRPVSPSISLKSDLDLPAFLVQANLKPVSIEKVNIPRFGRSSRSSRTRPGTRDWD